MRELLDLVKILVRQNEITNELIADYFPNTKNHLIGIDGENDIILFIDFMNAKGNSYGQSSGRFLEVNYDVNCSFERHSDKSKINQNFCILKLKNVELDTVLKKYFLNLCLDLVTKLGDKPDIIEIHTFIEKTKQLFAQLTQTTTTDEIGLWGELFLINESSDLEYIIDAWHINKTDRFDFNDGINKIEIKTTTKSQRIHHFSLTQLDKLLTSKTMICSIMTCKIDLGLSVYDLYENILFRINDKYKDILREKIFKVAGNQLSKFAMKFDSEMARASCKYYSSKSIPSINEGSIDIGVTNVEFDSDLQNINPVDMKQYRNDRLFSILK
ncbi:PD-(D/E)XK motif protein [Flavobacterium bizetiae]|uniref:PD-(D/E)XK motif protein n=1 Tax=Flavobacterium bizetiae TaxID=2704140 RepID=UPI00375713F3